MKEYFSHDYNARNDNRLVRLQMKHGMAGMGVFWCIVEMLYESGGYLLIEEYARITFELRANYEVVKSVIEDYDLFKNDGEKFWSASALERLKKRTDISETARQNISKRWDKYGRNTGVLPSKYEGNTIKVKENKRKDKYTPPIIPPTEEDVIAYFDENGYTKSAGSDFWNYYDTREWKDKNGYQVKNWKNKAREVWFRDDRRKPKEPADPFMKGLVL